MTGLSNTGTVEFVAEGTYGTFPTNPAMKWIGLVQKATITARNENEDYRSLRASGATNKLIPVGNIKTGATLTIDLEYIPNTFKHATNPIFCKYATHATGGDTMQDILPTGLSFGFISADSTPKYAKISGGQIDEWTCEIPEDKLARITAKVPCADLYLNANDPWTTDYVGSGSHASEVTTALGYADITTLTLGGASFKATNIKFGVRNSAIRVKDAASTKFSKVESIVPQKREFFFSAKVRRDAINDFSVKTFGYGANNLVIAFGTAGASGTLTFANAKVPEEVYNFAVEGLSEMEINFTGITGLTYS